MAVKVEQTENRNVDSYVSDFIRSYNSQYESGQHFFLSPQMLNTSLKNINMGGIELSDEDIKRMVLAPHEFEMELRKLSYYFYNTVSIYKQDVNFKKSILDFDWNLIPYRMDGEEITMAECYSIDYKNDYKELTKFFNSFDVKSEFRKVVFNLILYDTYYTSIREYDGHIYLQELPASHCIIDAQSYLGYLFSFDLSYFTNAGVDINGYSPDIIKKYNKALKLREGTYNPNLPQRNGAWVYWQTMHPDNAWVFKFNTGFAGSVPPVLDMLRDYNKLDKFKDLEEAKKELEVYKVIFATVPRLTNGRSGNKVDDFAISATELGKFIATVKSTLGKNVDFKAAPLDNFKAFDFSPSASEQNLLATEVSNMLKETGLSDSVLIGGNSVSALNMYKLVKSEQMKQLYDQFEKFCEYQINKRTKKYKFKIKFTGTIFDREERRKASNEDMERGIITPSIFSSRGIQLTDANNVMNLMHSLGFPDKFTPIKTASTMSSEEKETVGRTKKSEATLTKSGEQTRDTGANDEKKEV